MPKKLNVDTVKVADLNKMEKDELAKICKRSGLHPGGQRDVLIQRITEAKSATE